MSSHHTEPDYNLERTLSAPEEEIEQEHEHEMPEGHSDTVEGMEDSVNDNVEIRTETPGNVEQLQDAGIRESLDESYVESSADTSLTHEFEENERRLDIESDDATAITSDLHEEEATAGESEETEGCTEESGQSSEEVLNSSIASICVLLCDKQATNHALK